MLGYSLGLMNHAKNYLGYYLLHSQNVTYRRKMGSSLSCLHGKSDHSHIPSLYKNRKKSLLPSSLYFLAKIDYNIDPVLKAEIYYGP